MASRVNVELSAQVESFVQGMNTASESAQKYETDQRKVRESLGNFNQELRKAKKEVMNLAGSYAKLDAAAKQSTFGQEMKRQLDEAKNKAAEYVDMQGDLQQELRNLASDTKTLDILADGMGLVGDATSATMGIIAQFTGREEDAKRAVVAFTTAQSALGTVTKLQNALQKQSNIMLGVAKVQSLAAAAAKDIEATSTGKATIAQKAFNLVAKANPYVLLATAVITLTAAIAAFVIASNKAESATAKLNKELHATSIQGQKDAQQDVVKLDLLYAATQNVNLSMKDREQAAKKLIDLYPGYFRNMSTEQIMLGQASDKYRQLRDDIIAVAKAKAYEQKITSLSQELVDVEDELETAQAALKTAEAAAHSYDNSATNFAHGAGQINMALVGMKKNSDAYDSAAKKVDNLTKKQNELNTAINKYTDRSMALQGNVNRLESGTKKPEKPTKGGSGSGNIVKDIQATAGSIAALEKQISTLQDLAQKGALPDDLKDPAKFKATLQILQKQLKDLKIKWGFEKPETKLQELQAKLEAAKQKYVLAVEANDEQARQAAQEEYYAAENELKKYKLSIQIEPQIDPAVVKKQLADIQKIVDDVFNHQDAAKFNFNSLPENMRSAADRTLNEFERVTKAQEELTKIMNDPNSSDTQIAAAQHGLEKIGEKYDDLIEKLQEFQNVNDDTDSTVKRLESLKEKLDVAASVADSTSSVFGSLGQAFSAAGDESAAAAMQVVGSVADMVAQVIPQIISLIGARQAEAMASGVAGAAAMPYPASIAAIASIVATIVATFASILSAVGAFADGGIVGGNSYTGDKLLARVNSGELILNQRQQRNVNNMLDEAAMPKAGGTNVTVQGVVRGTDLMLVQKNTSKTLARSGNSIRF